MHQGITIKSLFFIFACLNICFLSACSSTQNDKNSGQQDLLNYQQSNADYAALVNKIQANQALPEDYDLLIKIYPLTSFYEPKNTDEQRAKLVSQTQMRAGMWDSCLKTNKQLLNINYTSLTGHYGASVCATEQGQIELGKFHNAVLDNLIEAIWRTGNGQTPQTPLYITSVNDLYAFIQLHQLVAVGQSITYVNQLPIQAITIQNPETLRTFTWYFDITPQFRRAVIDKLEGN